jgi:hypothetical protein
VLDDPHPSSATLTDILVLARSSPSHDELLGYFVSCVPELVGCDEVEVRPAHSLADGPDDDAEQAEGHVSCHPVVCDGTVWGELRLTYLEGPPGLGEVRRGRLLAEVLGVALLSARSHQGVSSRVREPGAPGTPTGHPDPDDLVEVVLDCAEALDLMADASTRARLALVATRVSAVVGATSWSVGVVHRGTLYDVARAGAPSGGDGSALGDGTGSGDPVPLADFPARMRASEGAAYHADRSTGGDAERRALVDDGHEAVVGAGGYDLDGRAWLVEVFADSGPRLEHVTPVLLSLVMAALSFPREAVVPRPVEASLSAILDESGAGYQGSAVRGIGEAG